MDFAWLPIAAFLIGLYFFALFSYRLVTSSKALFREVSRTNRLLEEIRDYQRIEPEAAQAATEADLEKLLSERRKLRKSRLKRHQERERRLVQRIRDIEIDKRWA